MRIRSRRAFTALAALTAVAAVTGSTGLAAPDRAAAAPRTPDVRGVWQTDGYGTAVVVGDRTLRTYDTTAVSCLPGALRAG
ncbi:peptidase S41, partial [Streptomyces sp. SB3404]|nr:peptidase S41 [Streptomyces boncukensis]